MKIAYKKWFMPVLSIFVICLAFTHLKCKHDTTSISVVRCYYAYDSTTLVPNAEVLFIQGNILDTAYTSNTGDVEYKRELEAILDVHVFVDTINGRNIQNWHYYGNDLLRLVAGETVELNIYVDTIIPTQAEVLSSYSVE